MSREMLATQPPVRIVDNPLLIAQARRRLRRSEVGSTVTMGVLFSVCCLLLGAVFSSSDGKYWHVVRWGFLFLSAISLHLRATTRIALSISEERISGLLDFHRAAPTTAWTNAIGYVFGCAAREWLLAGIFLPFFLIASVIADRSLPGSIAVWLVLAVYAVFYQTLALWNGLSGGRRWAAGASMAAVLGALLMASVASNLGLRTLAFLTPLPAVGWLEGWENPALGADVDFFGLAIPSLIFSVVVTAHFGAFAFVAVARKLGRDGAASFSRPGALLFFALTNLLMLGGSWSALGSVDQKTLVTARSIAGIVASAYLCGATVMMMMLLASLAPDHLGFVRAMRRARRQGKHDAGPLDEGGSTLMLIPVFGVIAVGGQGLVMLGAQGSAPWSSMLGLPTALALLASAILVAFTTGAAEFLKLTMRAATRSGAWLIAFLTLVMPWMLAALVTVFPDGEAAALFVAAFSPLYTARALCLPMELWAAEPHEVDLVAIGLSMVITAAASAVFWMRVVRHRDEAATTTLATPR